ncbi:hypothetical protein OAJ36_01315 [Nitrosopumilus sp.]|nr:hypothetical protein [Nitrosopumilus sp.]
MNNEIGRKLTSLTLMTIMLAGGMTIAAPSMMPQAAAAGALYVSAENAMFNNTFGGAQVIEVVVIGIADETDEKQGEPVVKVDNNQLRMAQGVDGAWYGYFADSTQSTAADGNSFLDYGTAGATSPLEGDFNEAVGSWKVTSTALPTTVITNFPVLSNWNKTDSTQESTNPNGLHYGKGQIGLNPAEWPVIQTYDFTAGDYTFDVVLEQAGADEVVTLTHDSADLDDYASMTLDRNSASQESDIHLVITDNQLNIDPTAEDIVSFYVASGAEAVSWMNRTINATTDAAPWTATSYAPYSNAFDDNGKLIINNATNGGSSVLVNDVTIDDATADNLMIFYEGGENSGIFYNTDDNDNANINVADYAKRGFTATFDYNDSAQSFVVANYFGTIDMDAASVGDVWNSGEALTVTLIDEDLNKNTASDEDLVIANTTNTQLIPALQIGSPLSLSSSSDDLTAAQVSSYSKIAYYTNASVATTVGTEALPYIFDTGYTGADVNAMSDDSNTYFNWHTASFNNGSSAVDDSVKNTSLINVRTGDVIIQASGSSGIEEITGSGLAMAGTLSTDEIHLNITKNAAYGSTCTNCYTAIPVIADIFSYGENTNNAIYRILLEETDDNTSVFEGSIEYMMLNQINIDLDGTYTDLATIDQDVDIIIEQDMTDEDSPRVNYYDLGADGVSTQIADQLEAPTHDGVVSFDMDNYKIADTVVVTLDDQDMNEDSELIDVYTTNVNDRVGDADATTLATGLVLDITFDDVAWISSLDNAAVCTTAGSPDNGLEATGFTLVETGAESGIFTGSFQVPSTFCHETKGTVTVTGTDIEVNYQDFRNASGESTEVGDGASINANTGSVAFDRTVYPVPYSSTAFNLHSTVGGGTLGEGNVTIHVRITDADYNVSAQGEDSITDANVTINIERGSSSKLLAVWGNTTAFSANGIFEVTPDSGVFELDQIVEHNDGPTDTCPSSMSTGCILQGDIITVEYADNNDASGKSQTVTDSATFDLRNGVLQSDKSVYLIGSDMILTLIEPDFDLDNDAANSVTLDLIEWDSDAATTTLGGKNGVASADATAFDPEPSELRETGDSTGIFQVVIEIPETLDGEKLDRGEMIELEYTDWGPAGADYVGQEDEDIGLTVYTSNFGATIELDQKVYTWTDKVYITIVAPDHNMDSGLVDEIGESADDPIKVSSRGNEIDRYKLVESGADTGIFIGEVTLAGMTHDADGDGTNDIDSTPSALTSDSYDGDGTPAQTGPTEGKLATTDNDGITVSFEFSEDETVVGSALVRWNIGEVQWLEASYPASGTGVVRVIDADMNLNPEAIDNFEVDAWSDSDAGGIDLTVTETNEATGIFEGTVFFTTSNDSSGHRLRVAEGDTVTAEYEDNTLPDPYTTADELDITATSLIGTVVPPLERAPAANLRTVDAFGNSLNAVSVDQQVQLTADLANGQDREQSFAYLVQVQDGDGVTVSLAWITGSLSSGQSFSPALSWIPTESGSYTATAFVWESVDNPTALSPPVSTTISVQ